MNRILATMMVDGTYARAYEKWIGDPYTAEFVAGLEAQKNGGSPVPEAKALGKALPSSANPTARASRGFSFRFDILREFLPRLLRGAVLTLELTALSLCFGVAGGLALALLRLSPHKALRPPAIAYVEVVRGTPLLMQIYVIYFVLPAFGIGLSPLVAGVLAPQPERGGLLLRGLPRGHREHRRGPDGGGALSGHGP